MLKLLKRLVIWMITLKETYRCVVNDEKTEANFDFLLKLMKRDNTLVSAVDIFLTHVKHV